jgi:hypothetical protein
MLLIWRGWGILGLLIPILALGLGMMVAEAVAPSNAAVTGIVVFIFCLAGAATVWVVGERLNSRPGRLLVDPATGEKVVLRSTHSLFWIPLQWWAIVAVLFALVFAIAVPQLQSGSYGNS